MERYARGFGLEERLERTCKVVGSGVERSCKVVGMKVEKGCKKFTRD